MNKRQEQILKAYRSSDDGEFINYYGNYYFKQDVSKSIEQLDYDADKITLAQAALDFNLASQLISNSIKDEKQKELYEKLKETNIDLDETINIELLSDKYTFLGGLLESIVTDIAVQQRLISLSDEKLELFRQLFNKIKSEISNPIPIITKTLRCLGTSPSNCGIEITHFDEHSKEYGKKQKKQLEILVKTIQTEH